MSLVTPEKVKDILSTDLKRFIAFVNKSIELRFFYDLGICEEDVHYDFTKAIEYIEKNRLKPDDEIGDYCEKRCKKVHYVRLDLTEFFESHKGSKCTLESIEQPFINHALNTGYYNAEFKRTSPISADLIIGIVVDEGEVVE